MGFTRPWFLALLLLAPLVGHSTEKLAPVVQEEVELNSAQRARIRNACYEIVVPRADGNDLAYEKPLPWELVPFRIRNDHYVSIGTAFAISRTELVTAYHVLELNQECLTYQHYYIRDQDQKVWELDKIAASNQQKDVVRFTVKGRTFDQWLDLEPGYQVNGTVYTVGNAYGEGVVIRRGELVGMVAEDMDGAFQWLKSSANVNPGNSGGPLVDSAGRVIGVVRVKKDNLCYSLPIMELLNLKKDTATFHTRLYYNFVLYPGKTRPVLEHFEVPLPMAYGDLIHAASRRFLQSYRKEVATLIAENGEPFRAEDPAAFAVIHKVPDSTFPQYLQLDKNIGNWVTSGLTPKSVDLDHEGRMRVGVGSDLGFFRLSTPTNLALKDLYGNPKQVMDLIYRSLKLTRTIGEQEIRITSLGEPIRSTNHLDRFGRPWCISVWLEGYANKLSFLATTPVPGGLVMLLKETTSDKLEVWTDDMQKLLDFVLVPYTGKLKEWKEFLARPQALPAALRQVRLTYQPDGAISIRSPWLSLDLGPSLQAIQDDSQLSMQMGLNRSEGKVIWELRRFVLDEVGSGSYFVLNKVLKPMDGMNEDYLRSWRNAVNESHPYTGKSYFENGATKIATVLPVYRPLSGDRAKAPALWVLHVGRSGTVPDAQMKTLLDQTVAAINPGDGK